MKAISRIDHKRTHCWWVRLCGRRPKIQRSFPDARYGSREAAFHAAQEFRDTCQEILVAGGTIRKGKVLIPWSKLPQRQRDDHLGKVYVGTGIVGAWKAYKAGVSRSPCRRIMAGRQDFYSHDGGHGYLSWGNVVPEKQQKKKVVRVGTGIEAARIAQSLGAKQSTCSRIKSGKQSVIYLGGGKSSLYERNGKLREITPEIYEWVSADVHRYCRSFFSEEEMDGVVNDILLTYVATDVSFDEDYIVALTKKWTGIHKMRKRVWEKRKISFDINGQPAYRQDDMLKSRWRISRNDRYHQSSIALQ